MERGAKLNFSKVLAAMQASVGARGMKSIASHFELSDRQFRRAIPVTSSGVSVAELVPRRRGRGIDAQVALEVFADAPRIDLRAFVHNLDVIGNPDYVPRG